MQNSRYLYAHGGLSSLKEARDLLHSHAPKGEHLAYINPQEANLLKKNGGSGIMTASGIRSYGILKSITRPIAKILDKIVPNEIKPALPYLAAIAPFTGMFGTLAGSMPGFGLTGPALDFAQRGLLGAAVNAGSQLSQEGAADRGLNLPSLGLSTISAGLSGGTAGQFLEGFRPTVGGEADLGTFDTLLSKGISGLQKGAEVLNTGREADLFSTDFAKAAATPLIGAAAEQAYNAAQKALDEYNSKLGNIKNMTQADLAERRKYVQQYMSLAGFGQSDIDSALSRQGLMRGGRAGYEAGSNNEGVKTIPINLDTIAKQLFGDKLDNLTYTQKETVYNRYYDLKDKKAKGGLMSLGGREMDFRAAGGFVPIGKKERADDVPARLSKNEFVFTAKAVRNAGNGNIGEGAKRMYQIMKRLEARA